MFRAFHKCERVLLAYVSAVVKSRPPAKGNGERLSLSGKMYGLRNTRSGTITSTSGTIDDLRA